MSAAVARAVEEVCAKFGLSEDVEAVMAAVLGSLKETRSLVQDDLSPQQARVLRVLQGAKGGWVHKEVLAEAIGQPGSVWAIRNHIACLRRRGYPVENKYGGYFRLPK